MIGERDLFNCQNVANFKLTCTPGAIVSATVAVAYGATVWRSPKHNGTSPNCYTSTDLRDDKLQVKPPLTDEFRQAALHLPP